MTDKNQSQGRFAKTLTFSITTVTKLIGLASAFNQLLLQSNPKALPLTVAAFMMAGAQLSEGLILMGIDRVMQAGVVASPTTPTKKAEGGEK